MPACLAKHVKRVSFFLHRERVHAALRVALFAKAVDAPDATLDTTFVDTRQGKRPEVEPAATMA